MADSPDRRAPKAFEPPPWEREQFDELAKNKQAEEAEATPPPGPGDLPAEEAPEPADAKEPGQWTAEPVASGGSVDPRTESSAKVDDAALVEMMATLAAEEPPATQGLWQLGVIVAVGIGALGLMMLVIGAVGLSKTADSGPIGVLGGTILVGFGIGMIAIAVWMTVRTLKQRGVL